MRIGHGPRRLACLLGTLGTLVAPASMPADRAAAIDPATPLVIPTTVLPGGATGLRAGIDGHPGLFLFDTGAGVTLVTPETGVASGCRPWGQVTGFRATGERMTTPRCDDVPLAIGGRNFTAPTASVLDLQPMMPPGMPRLSGVLALDVFAGHAITIRPVAHELVVETPASLRQRCLGAREVPVRLVRDAQGLALTVDGAVRTPAGRAWMELDTGNGGPVMVDEHVARPLGLAPENRDIQQVAATLAGGIPVRGPARVSGLIMDGDIGEAVLAGYDLTLDLAGARAWFRPATPRPTVPR